MLLRILGCILSAYLLGSLSASILLTRRLYHQDVRQMGSGNAGATNVARIFGWKAGALTFLGDCLKGVLAMLLGRWILGDLGTAISGISCLIGHCFPVFFGFRGGKAVSTGAAVALMLDWRLFVLCLIVFVILALSFKFASVASMSASAVVAVGAFFFTQSPALRILGVFTCLLVLIMHRSNIKRLLKGTEPRFHAGTPQKKGE